MLLSSNFAFAQVGDVIQQISDHVRVWHDEVGTPHVVASTTYGVYFGYGYCLGRDRMFQLELLRRSTEGTLAEVFGEAYIDADLMARRDAVSFAELEYGLNKASEPFKQALRGFTDGINRSINQARKNRFRLDPAFKKAGINPALFSQIQVLNIFAGTMAARYNDFSQELDNQRLLSFLVRKYGARTASNIFEDLIFYQDSKVYSTLGNMRYFKPGYRFSATSSVHGKSTAPTHLPTLRNRKRNKNLKKLGIPDKSGSYGAVLSHLYKGKKQAWVFGGPQMGYFNPSALYAIGLHTPEFDVVGTTPVGYLCILFAANKHIAFTATAGVGNLVDILALKQHPHEDYILLGGNFSCQKEKRLEHIMVKGKRKPVLREVYETVAGPVIDKEDNIWYVKHRSWKGKVVSSYQAWFDSNFAENLDEWLEYSDKNALSINWLGADKNGNIAFVHCGMGKDRKSYGDDRLPVTIPADFSGSEKRLAAKNPATGFYANWNCPPIDGFRNGDMQTGWAADQRSKYLADHIAINHSNWSVDYLKQLDQDIGFTDQRAYFFKDFLLDFVEPGLLSPVQFKALTALTNWNNQRTDRDQDGYLDDPAAGIFEAWFNNLYCELFAKYLQNFAWIAASDQTWTQSALLARALLKQTHHDYLAGKDPRNFVTEIFIGTVNEVCKDGYNLPDFESVRMQFAPVNHIGAPTVNEEAGFTPFMNRGSDVQIVSLSPEGIKIMGCLPPGNSARGSHSDDQVDAFRNFKYYPRALTMKEVRRLRGRYMVLEP
jgi:penicillin amidase